jgi:hypothetical protein
MLPFDSDQTGARLRRHDARSSQCQEAAMKKVTARATAQPAMPAHEAVAIWTVALWLLAAVFLLTTVQIY